MTEFTVAAIDGRGEMGGYLALPPGGKGPGLIIIQEIFGVNAVMRGVADHFASLGCVAYCPDLFWRIEPGIQLTDKTDAEWARAFELFKTFDKDKGVEDLQAAITALRGHAKVVNGKIGTIGYCLGGHMAYRTACQTDADAAIGYYGVGIGDITDLGVKNPLMLHIAEEDEFVSKDEQAAIKAAFDGNGHVTIHSYEGRDHAFARVGGAHYHEEDAKTANQRTAMFMKEHLR